MAANRGTLSITAAVLLAFGLTFGVWVATGYSLSRRIHETRRDTAEITARYMDAQQLLATVNAQILLGSVYIRDALLSEEAGQGEPHEQVERTFASVRASLAGYVPVMDTPNERERLARLRAEVEDFRKKMLAVLDTARAVSPAQARYLLWRDVVPRRDVVIRVSEEIRSLNREAFVKQQSDVAEIYASSQRWFWIVLSLSIVAGFGIALVVVRHAARLEGRLQRQLALDEANALELTRLSEKLISAQEEERRTIARELHDEVGQGLTAIKVELMVAEKALGVAGGHPQALENVRAITDQALSTIRNLSHLLHPAVLDDLGLAAALESYVRTFAQRFQLEVSFHRDSVSGRFSPEVETAVYRIVQEALTNVAKHARASACRVALSWQANHIRLEIEDNGVGLPGDRPQGASGLGLVSIRGRAQQLQGTFVVDAVPNGGTRLTVVLPAVPRAAASTNEPEGSPESSAAGRMDG